MQTSFNKPASVNRVCIFREFFENDVKQKQTSTGSKVSGAASRHCCLLCWGGGSDHSGDGERDVAALQHRGLPALW